MLIFAIFIASLGLNLNSTAVIIGAMLISPLMGPIMGIGLGIGINDLTLLRKSIYNYLIATGAALTTSTIFFLLSPLNAAHSEILARTSPSIYDVLIALFGGFAGIIATSSRQKGNVIPGVAIATALMPPLCTAGYGLATFQFNFFYGAFYLFIINTVFIALATFIIVRLLHFPHKHLQNKKADKIANRVIGVIVLATLLPSIYFGYDMVQQDRFIKNANRFIANEAHFPNDYLLNKKLIPNPVQ
ncbi:MAG: TIGR00341 family protein [Chitinophagaceae bacterium]|nr:TIGR00341 family protein [Chitinophagaceae bacterium]